MGEDIKLIAARIRELRDVYGFSADEIASELKISTDTYLKYEEDGSDIPISVLYHLANKYRVNLSEILTGTTPRLTTFCVVPDGQGIRVDRYAQYHMESLAHRFPDKVMEPMLVILEPQEHEPALVTHKGQEFNYVLDGSIYLLIDEKKLLLNKGDCAYFDPTHPHGQMAANDSTATFLTVITEKSSSHPEVQNA